MNKWLANHCWTPTITWTASTACIARKVQAMRWDGMWKVKIWNIWRNWFWSKNHCNRNRSDGKQWIGLSRETGPVTNNRTLDQAAFLKITSFTIACGMWSWILNKNTMTIWHAALLKYQKDTFGHLTTEIWTAIWKLSQFLFMWYFDLRFSSNDYVFLFIFEFIIESSAKINFIHTKSKRILLIIIIIIIVISMVINMNRFRQLQRFQSRYYMLS